MQRWTLETESSFEKFEESESTRDRVKSRARVKDALDARDEAITTTFNASRRAACALNRCDVYQDFNHTRLQVLYATPQALSELC
jgi:hypothetical protein